MGAKVRNPRKKFLWSITFIKHPINPYLFQKVTIPGTTVEQVPHGDTNHSVKTAGRVEYSNLQCERLETTSGSDTWLSDWIASIADPVLGGGLSPDDYYETVKIDELAEDGKSILNSWICEGVWPTKLNDQDLDRMSSDNTMESIEFSVNSCYKI